MKISLPTDAAAMLMRTRRRGRGSGGLAAGGRGRSRGHGHKFARFHLGRTKIAAKTAFGCAPQLPREAINLLPQFASLTTEIALAAAAAQSAANVAAAEVSSAVDDRCGHRVF